MIYIVAKSHLVAENFIQLHSLNPNNCCIMTRDCHVHTELQGVKSPLVITLGGWKRDRPLPEIDSIYSLLHSRSATITKVTDW